MTGQPLRAQATVPRGTAFDTVKEAARGALDGIERVAPSRARRNECKADGLAVCVGTVEFAASDPCIGKAAVGYKGNALAAVTAVVEQARIVDGANALEKLIDILFGQVVVQILNADLVCCLFVGGLGTTARGTLGTVATGAGGATGVVVFEAVVDPVSVEIPGIISLTRLLSQRGMSD